MKKLLIVGLIVAFALSFAAGAWADSASGGGSMNVSGCGGHNGYVPIWVDATSTWQCGANGSGSMSWPGAGVAVSLGASWDTSLNAANYAAINTQLGLTIGTNTQAYNANLTTYAGITPSANVQSFLGASNYAGMKTLMGYPTTAADVYGLWSGTKDSSHCLAGDGTMQACAGGGGSMTYPSGTGLAVVSSGASWGTTISISSNVASFLAASNYAAMKTLMGYIVSGDAVSLGPITLPAGTTSNDPFIFQSGSKQTSAAAGHVAYDGTVWWLAPSTTWYAVPMLTATITAAGQVPLSTTTAGVETYSGWLLSGTAAQTYTFPSTSKTLMASDFSNASSGALPDGTTETTQAVDSNDTKLATDAYVDNQFVITGTSLTAGAAYYLNSSTGLALAKADSSSTLPAVCVATSTTICRKLGHYTTTSLTLGSIYYVSAATAGLLTATAPASVGQFVQRVGVASSTTVLEVMPSLDVLGL